MAVAAEKYEPSLEVELCTETQVFGDNILDDARL